MAASDAPFHANRLGTQALGHIRSTADFAGLLGFLWGASFLFVEILLNYISPFMIVYLRVSLASLLLILYLILSKIKSIVKDFFKNL